MVLQCLSCCKFLLKFWISSFDAMWLENQVILLMVGLDSQYAATTFLSSCDLVLPLLILFCGFLVVERGAREPMLNRSNEIQAQTLTEWDTFLCPSLWCSPCSQFCVPRPFTSLLLQFRNSIEVSWVLYLWGWRTAWWCFWKADFPRFLCSVQAGYNLCKYSAGWSDKYVYKYSHMG